MCVVFPDGPYSIVEVEGYEHLDPDDRPCVGINFLSPGQDLFREFESETTGRLAFVMAEDNEETYKRYVAKRRFLEANDL